MVTEMIRLYYILHYDTRNAKKLYLRFRHITFVTMVAKVIKVHLFSVLMELFSINGSLLVIGGIT